MKNLFYRVFAENKWTSTLFVFLTLATLMTLWTIATSGPDALDLTKPTEFVLRMTLPILLSTLYIVYRFVGEGRSKPNQSSGVESGVVEQNRPKSILNLVVQLVILCVITWIAGSIVFLYFFYLGIPTYLPFYLPVLNIITAVLSLPTTFFWIWQSVRAIKQSHNSGTKITVSKKIYLMFLALLSFYFIFHTYTYITFKIYEKDFATRGTENLIETKERFRTSWTNQPTYSTEGLYFYDFASQTATSACNPVIEDRLHPNAMLASIENYYCNKIYGENIEHYYRFLYEKKGIYISPIFGDTSFKIIVPSNTFIDEEENVYFRDEGSEWLRIGGYEVRGGKTFLLNVGTKILYLNTTTENFKDFEKEIKAVVGGWGEDVKIKTDETGGLSKIVVTSPDRVAGGTTTSLYLFLGPGKYLLFQNVSNFVINTLQRN